MRHWFKQLDRILRGEATRLSALRAGTIDLSVGGLSAVLLILGLLYGLCMGVFSVIASGGRTYAQLLATTVKVPALFFLTLLITFPSLYVFNALVGSRLTIKSVMRLLVAALGVMLTVLASLGTIVAFFSVSTSSYSFMILLNVVVFAISGFLGLLFLLQTLHRLSIAQEPEAPIAPVEYRPSEAEATTVPPPLPGATEPSAIERVDGRMLGSHTRVVFRIWIIVFGLVGAQMGWVLRPFIGNPNLPFTLFRTRHSNFFEAVLHHIWNLIR
ncbi:MAG TPA: hypothetical protein VGQ99_13910 [Tepidisphaeraceae bacterium]|jgi:hypothetical protein|nr:hypothetical protein [Tepidisphaeraceae bacterium]